MYEMKMAFWQRQNHAPPTEAVAEASPHFALGQRGERMALAYLEHAGYRIVAANFSVPVGRNSRGVLVNAEIDIVAFDAQTLCFIEVKTRASEDFAPPQ